VIQEMKLKSWENENLIDSGADLEGEEPEMELAQIEAVDVYFCSPLRSRILWSLLSSNRSKLSNPTALGFHMGNTCAAYWMPPIAVIAPTMIANGGSDSKGMCSVFCLCFSRVLFQNL
jgi:hypothetical protein